MATGSLDRDLSFFLHPDENWCLGLITEIDKKDTGTTWKVVSCNEDGTVDEQPLEALVTDESNLSPVVDNALAPVKDLLNMPYLHDSTLLYQVRANYWKKLVYTNIGPIVLALNPYDYTIPHYMNDQMEKYMQEGKQALYEGSKQLTHAWNVGHTAYWSMLEFTKPQSILVSGESGAGKTEAAKIVLRYLSEVSTHQASAAQQAAANLITHRVEKCSPILESFGNAKTVRNDNSSRFGKFMKIQFNNDGLLCGAHTTNYLLEKSRVITHARGERCYHSLYQLVFGATPEERERYHLQDPLKFAWLFKGGEPTEAEKEHDTEMYGIVREAMDVVGMSKDEQDAVYRIIAGILHIQCVEITGDRAGNAVLSPEAKEVISFVATELWRVNPEGLMKEFTTAVTALFEKPLTKDQANDARDAASKALYKEMFDSLVKRINDLLNNEKECHPSHWIGLLDIFGFENFEKNSFEQLCINYANEQLQNHYNQHVFARDIKEYEAEGIDIAHVTPPDNQPTIDLIVHPTKMSLFALLNDQAKAAGSDKKFLESIREHHWQKKKEHKCLDMPRIDDNTFSVKHYAATVKYLTTGFKDKNMDNVSNSLKLLFRASSCPYIAQLLPEPEAEDKKGAKSGPLMTVSNFFKGSMQALMTTIEMTNPFWIRCVKPHSAKKPRMFNGNEVMNQLRSAGVLETVKIRKSGYSWRIPHFDFWRRFRIITGDLSQSVDDPAAACRTILEKCEIEVGLCQLGKTKVFLKDSGYNKMEDHRNSCLTAFVVMTQRLARVKWAQWVRLCRKMLLDARLVHGFAMARCSEHVMRVKEFERFKRRLRAALLTQRELRAKDSLNVRHTKYLVKGLTLIQANARAQYWQMERRRMEYELWLKLTAIATMTQRHIRAKESSHVRYHLQLLAYGVRAQQMARAKISAHERYYHLLEFRGVQIQQFARAKLSLNQRYYHQLQAHVTTLQQTSRAKASSHLRYYRQLEAHGTTVQRFARAMDSDHLRYRYHLRHCAAVVTAFATAVSSQHQLRLKELQRHERRVTAADLAQRFLRCKPSECIARSLRRQKDLVLVQSLARSQLSQLHTRETGLVKARLRIETSFMLQRFARGLVSVQRVREVFAERFKRMEPDILRIQLFGRSALAVRRVLNQRVVRYVGTEHDTRLGIEEEESGEQLALLQDEEAGRAEAAKAAQLREWLAEEARQAQARLAQEHQETDGRCGVELEELRAWADIETDSVSSAEEIARQASAAALAQAVAEERHAAEQRDAAARKAAEDEAAAQQEREQAAAREEQERSARAAEAAAHAEAQAAAQAAAQEAQTRSPPVQEVPAQSDQPHPSKVEEERAQREQQAQREQAARQQAERSAEPQTQAQAQQPAAASASQPRQPHAEPPPQQQSPPSKQPPGPATPPPNKQKPQEEGGWFSRLKKAVVEVVEEVQQIPAVPAAPQGATTAVSVPAAAAAAPGPGAPHVATAAHEGNADVALLLQQVEKLQHQLAERSRECEQLKLLISEERKGREIAEHRLSEKTGEPVPSGEPAPLPDDAKLLGSLADDKAKELQVAQETVRRCEEEWIALRRRAILCEPTDHGRQREVLARTTQDVQTSCSKASAVFDVEEPLDLSSILKIVAHRQQHFVMLCPQGEQAEEAKLLKHYHDQLTNLQAQLSMGKGARFLEKRDFMSFLEEPLEMLLETTRLNATIAAADGMSLNLDVLHQPPEAGCLHRTPLDPQNMQEVMRMREEAVAAARADCEQLKRHILDLRQAATGIADIKKKQTSTATTKATLLKLMQEYAQQRDMLTGDEMKLKKIKKDFDEVQSRSEAKIHKELAQVTEKIVQLRSRIHDRRKQMQDDVVALAKLEWQKAIINKEMQSSQQLREDVDAVVVPRREDVMAKQQALNVGTTILAKEASFVEDVERLANNQVRTLKTTVYQRLGEAHSKLWVASKAHWNKLRVFFDVESATFRKHRMELEEQQNHLQAIMREGTPETVNEVIDVQTQKIHRIQDTLQESQDVLQGLCKQFEDIAQFLKTLKTFDFLNNDPKLQHYVRDNFLEETFWRDTKFSK